MNLNIRFGLIFWAVQCAWILGEYVLGWHTTDVDVTRGAQGFFFFPAAAVMAWGLVAHKRQNAALTYLNALKMGAVVGLVVGLLSVPFHWAYTTFLNPDYAAHMIDSMVATGTATLEEATQQFAMPSYAFGLLIFPVVAGLMTNAILGLFMKTSWR